MADFSKSGCCGCQANKNCSDAFADFASELCPSFKSKDKDKAK